ncbi:MAG: NAD(FAD)-dependent dehydrogenase, partial [Candidatus Dadabacteria bacterium]
DYTITWGNVADKDFITFYISGDKVAAAAGNDRDADMAAAEELMRTGRMPAPDILEKHQAGLKDLLNEPD